MTRYAKNPAGSPQPPSSAAIDRRRTMKMTAALAALGAFRTGAAKAEGTEAAPGPLLPRQTALGEDVMTPPYGRPSIYEAGVVRRERTGGSPYPTRKAAVSLTPLQDLHGVITPNGLHYERHHFGVPTIDPVTVMPWSTVSKMGRRTKLSAGSPTKTRVPPRLRLR